MDDRPQQTSSEPDVRTGGLAHRLAPWGAALLVVALVVAVVQVVGHRGNGGRSNRAGATGTGDSAGSGHPPVLRLDGGIGTAGASGQPVGTSRSRAAYILSGTLPSGPPSAHVVTFAGGSKDKGFGDADVDALARTLGLTGPGENVGAGVKRWTGPAGTLEVTDATAGSTAAWSFVGSAAADIPTDPALPSPAPVTPVRPQTSGPIGDQPAAVLTALGLDAGAAILTSDSPGWGAIVVDPVVDGVPTSGMTTTLQVVGGIVANGFGRLGRPVSGPAYPLTTAAQAWKRLRDQPPMPQPMIMCPNTITSSGNNPERSSCGSVNTGPITVTGASLGLVLTSGADGPLLVPAWLFQIGAGLSTIPVIAVEPAYIAPSDTVSGSAGGGTSGSVGSGTMTAKPLPDASLPAPNGSRFTAVTRSTDDRSLSVTFFGGVDTCYDYTVDAVETGATVTLSLVEHPKGQDVCVDLAQERTLTVALREPLGVRRVVDAVSGESVLGPTR